MTIIGISIAILFIHSLSLSQTVDVLIKGVDDGVKTNKQQDYNEALMNAKQQHGLFLDRAGVPFIRRAYADPTSVQKRGLVNRLQALDINCQPADFSDRERITAIYSQLERIDTHEAYYWQA